MGAFNRPSGNLVLAQDFYALGLVNAALAKTVNVFVPSSVVSGVTGATKLTATIVVNISALAGAAQNLKVEIQNLTQATGEVFQQDYTVAELGYNANLQIPCFGGDELEITYTYTTTAGTDDATFESSALVNLTAKV